MTRTAGALRALATLLYGVLPIALLVVGYQLFYVPAQTAYLHSRNHRFLATASEQIVRRLQGFAWALDSAVAECSGRLLENLNECPNEFLKESTSGLGPQTSGSRILGFFLKPGIGVFLFTTQRDVFDSTVGWITALTAGLSTAAPPLFRLFAMIMRPTVLTDSRSDGGGAAT